jgi:hypothetical protein
MAVSVNKDELPEKSGDSNPETKYIKAGNRLARLVSYVELGIHKQMYKGAAAKYETGKNAGREKPPVLHIGLTFEFPTCERTGDYPLTISTTHRLDNGEFINAVTVPQSLIDGKISKAMAAKIKFMKYLGALQAATSLPYASIAEFAKKQVPLLVNVTNNTSQDGKVYANMKPEGITSTRVEHPVTGEITDYSSTVPETVGDYCPVFDWDAPTAEAWTSLKPWDKTTIKAAINFKGSPIHDLLSKNPDLDAVQDGKADGNAAEDHSTVTEPTTPGTTADDNDLPV